MQQRQTRPTNNRNHLEQLKADSSSTSPAKPERLHLDLSSNPGGPSGRRQQQASETTPSRSLPEQQQNKQTKSSTSSELSGPGTNSTTAGSGDRPLTQVAGDGNAVARAKPSAKTTTSLAGGANEDHDLKRQVPGDGGGSGLDQRAAAARQHQHHEPSSKLLASAVGRMEPLERADNKDRLSLEAAAPPPTSMPPTRQQLIVGLGRPADSKANGKAARAQSWSGSSGSQSDATITTSSLTTTTTTNRPLNDNSNRSVVAARAHHHPNHLKQQPQSSRQREAYPSRETTRGGSTATATTTVETGEDDDEFGGSSARSSLAGGVSEELAEAVRAQVAEQLSVSSPIGRELTRQLSAYFGQPVEIRAVRPLGSGSSIASGSKSAASASRATDRPSAKAK